VPWPPGPPVRPRASPPLPGSAKAPPLSELKRGTLSASPCAVEPCENQATPPPTKSAARRARTIAPLKPTVVTIALSLTRPPSRLTGPLSGPSRKLTAAVPRDADGRERSDPDRH